MPFNEALFWFGITGFGTGLYFWVEGSVKRVPSITLTVLGALACAYSVYRYYHPESDLPAVHLWVILLVLTWTLLGYSVYVRRHSPKNEGGTSEADELYADTIFAWLRANIHTAGTFSAAGLAKSMALPTEAINRGLELLKTKYELVKKPLPAVDSWSY